MFCSIKSVFFACCLVSTAIAEQSVDFNRDIRPLLATRCFHCHGPDSQAREADLRLDNRAAALAELDSGNFAIVAGLPEKSEILTRVSAEDHDQRMPPPDVGPPLSEAEIQLLTRWIESGARFDQHWSLRPVRRRTPSKLSDAASAIDWFVLRSLQREKLRANPRADRYTLTRRASLALTGLPPSPTAADTFAANSAPDAYEQLVDRLLASPRFGERWARVWLDLARFADSAGYAQDPARTIWRYRDWVIDAYNANMPFDQFTIEQIAGDLLPNPSNEQLLATAFHRNTMTNSEGGTDDEEFRSAAVVDRVNTTGQIWLGLTLGCAQCHDHKYDDVSQEEYYRFFAIFNNTADADRGNESPWLEELSDDQRALRQKLQRQIDALEHVHGSETDTQTTERQNKLKDLRKQLAALTGIRTPIMQELTGSSRRETFVHVRGNFRVRGKSVTPGTPQLLPTLGGEPDRLALANWLVSKNNPLTARVVVNRYWEQLFGRGLVPTSEDFGTQGDLPSHPELLDFLAAELMRHDWDTKWLIKNIVLSDAYCRSSRVRPEVAQRDPENRWLARGPRFRLPAEMIRDQALAIGGLLSTKMRGPSVRPRRPKLGLRSAFGGSTDWETSAGEDAHRRGLYTRWRRTTPYPSMTTFDAPSREFCTVRRIRTNTPLQALVTLNDPVFVEAAQALARRVIVEGGESLESRLDFALRLVLIRRPEDRELARMRQLYEETHADYQSSRSEARKLATDPLGQVDDEMDLVELASWTVIGNVLLNLDETLAPL